MNLRFKDQGFRVSRDMGIYRIMDCGAYGMGFPYF